MPSLPARQIQAEGNDGTKFTAKIGIDVLGDGTFSIELPPELEVIAKKLKVPSAHVGYARQGAKARVYATELNAGIRLIRDAAEDYLRAEEVTERVICYTACINVSFWEEPDKQVAPNGCGRKGQWWGSKLHGHQFDACHRLDSFDVGFAAKVFDKITTLRKSGNTIVDLCLNGQRTMLTRRRGLGHRLLGLWSDGDGLRIRALTAWRLDWHG